MLKTFDAYLSVLQKMHDEVRKAVDGLPQAALDWSPGPEINSLAVLIAHTAGAERYWIADMVGREDSGRVRQREFETQRMESATLLALLDESLEAARRTLEALTLPDLEAMRATHDHREFSVSWCLAHALEHTSIHAGHMQLMRQWWDLQNQGSLRLDT